MYHLHAVQVVQDVLGQVLKHTEPKTRLFHVNSIHIRILNVHKYKYESQYNVYVSMTCKVTFWASTHYRWLKSQKSHTVTYMKMYISKNGRQRKQLLALKGINLACRYHHIKYYKALNDNNRSVNSCSFQWCPLPKLTSESDDLLVQGAKFQWNCQCVVSFS